MAELSLAGPPANPRSGDGGEAAPLLASASNDRQAILSPDGKWLAYRSGDALYVTAYPSLAQRVLIAPIASYPVWSRIFQPAPVPSETAA